MTAEQTHRALMNISTGELGSYQYRIEMELKRLLTYASKFNAIVLIDEADVFLEARKSGPADQLQQNAMVAGRQPQNDPFQHSDSNLSFSSPIGIFPGHYLLNLKQSFGL
jgi:hypothetical protein